ncbi:hypothetical protein JTE90_015262 [Oedothorax gibbosus]|uniref:Uncharacterized protein n=1 Tax=Oedothorax gibbosus TaxID=931172 RepID=A0AAV6TGQ7_9ARAC|nr:hypothetical protein JTE90_015262 [Oedothorax gibbosus]
MCLRFGRGFSLGKTVFPGTPLGPKCPRFNCCSQGNPFSQLKVSRLSLGFCYYPKICRGGGSRRAHPRHLKRTPPQTLQTQMRL